MLTISAMEKIKIEDVYYSYMRNGMIGQWRLDLVFRSEDHYECFFTNTETGEKEVRNFHKSNKNEINQRLEAIFCD